MIYLVISILLSALVTVIFKVTDKLSLNDDNLIFFNYLLAAAVSIYVSVKGGLYVDYFNKLSQMELGTLFSIKSVGNTYFLILVVGIIAGMLYIIDLFNTKNSVIFNGAGMTALFSKFGFLISTSVAAVLWKEFPKGLQIIGILIAVVALVIASGDLKELKQIKRPLLLVAMVIFGGAMELSSKTVVNYSLEGFSDLMVSTTFPTALILCAGYIVVKAVKSGTKITVTGRDVVGGLCLGLPNVLGNYLMLKALETIPSNIMFPTSAAGNLVVVSLAGVLVFKEKLNKKQMAAIGLMVVSLVLINIQ